MPFQNEIYYENQQGGLCRLHSINGYFGSPKISISEYSAYASELDEIHEKKYHEKSKTLEYDLISPDHNLLVSFILKKHDIYSRYLYINSVYSKKETIQNHLKDLVGDWFFIFNANHIYGARRKNDVWYIVDSLSGVRPTNIQSLEDTKDVGYIIPVRSKIELNYNISKLANAVNIDISGIIDKKIVKQKAIDYINIISEKRMVLGDIEVPMSIIIDILEFNIRRHDEKDQYKSIALIIDTYKEFMEMFTPDMYGSAGTDLKLKYIPDLILSICICCFKK